MKNPYFFFDKYLLRTPAYTLNQLNDGFLKYNYNLLKLYNDDEYFKKAILIAAPDFYDQLDSLINDNKAIDNLKVNDKRNLSLAKYFIRMCTRSTPYGSFAGVALGSVENTSQIIIDNRSSRNRYQFNNTFIHEVANTLSLDDNLGNLMLFANNLIYRVNHNYKYIEIKDNHNNGSRQFNLATTKANIILSKILKWSAYGIPFNDLLKSVTQEGYDNDSAQKYIQSLIANKVLLTDLEPFCGIEYFQLIKEVLWRNLEWSDLKRSMNTYSSVLEDLNNQGDLKNALSEISESKRQYHLDVQHKQPFKSTLLLHTSVNHLSKNILLNFKNLLPFFNVISPRFTNFHLKKFIDRFYDKYEFMEIKLTEVLDDDIGLGYPITDRHRFPDPLIENLNYARSIKEDHLLNCNDFLKVIHQKILNAHKESQEVIILEDSDFKTADIHWLDMPNTIYGIAKIAHVQGKEKVVINGFCGPSAINLLNRFAYADPAIAAFIKEISEKEKEYEAEHIIAEIIHNPNIHLSNVFEHPISFDYFIPILAQPVWKDKKVIPLDDLTIKLTSDKKIELRSRKFNKVVKPLLTNAHNHSKSDIPAYRLLTDLYAQDQRPYIGFQIDSLKSIFTHIPRFEYKNCIIFEAYWQINLNDPLFINIDLKNNDTLMEMVRLMRKKYNLPRLVLICQHDNELLIDFNVSLYIVLFFNELTKRKKLELKEFIFAEGSLVKDTTNNSFCNEMIVSFYKNLS